MIVLDASVVVKTYLAEDGSEAAAALVTGPARLVAPELIRLEVAAAFCRRVRRWELDPAEARVRADHWLGQLRRGLFTLTPDRDLLPDATELALELRHPLQDCLYLAAARRAGAPLVTADRAFHDRAAARFPEVRLLAGPPAD